MFLAGDVRANENIELTALQTLFMREHNRQAAILQQQHPRWTDEQLYQGARQIVIAEIQSITFNEFLPASARQRCDRPYTGYNPGRIPALRRSSPKPPIASAIPSSTTTCSFSPTTARTCRSPFTLPDGESMPVNTPADIASGETGISLVDAFFDPYVLEQPGVVGGDAEVSGLGQRAGRRHQDGRLGAEHPVRRTGQRRRRTRSVRARHPARSRRRLADLQRRAGRLWTAGGHQLQPDHQRSDRAAGA